MKIKQIADSFHLEASNNTGNVIQMDASPDIGGKNKGMRPMEMLLAAIGGCSSIDVILILKKQKQVIDSFEVNVEGDKEKVADYSLYRNICLHFQFQGNIDPAKAERAIKLSLEKYCSVSKTLESTAKITYKLSINNDIIV